ncbi:hypothetical protein E2C01_014117 [Portunus trituberculatus]|uniref:Uncharacterized protein n=1 Tax=Portunus trituberculatus TaxID=210409 RepID=A0A5B7DIC1_PORTR|nr:hypothetical protein [Portunus trituberculatus]
MSNSRSNVKHHPLVQEDSPLPGLSPIDSPVSGTPPRGLSPDRLLPEIDMEVFSTPHDPSLNLLEVPNTNWTRSPISSDPSSRASSTANLYDKPAGLAGMVSCGVLPSRCGRGDESERMRVAVPGERAKSDDIGVH